MSNLKIYHVSLNLWDEEYIGLTTSLTYYPIYVGEGQYTLSTTTPMNPNEAASLFFLAGNVSTGASTQYNGVWDKTSRTVTSSSGYVTIAYRYNEGVYVNPANYDTMLNKGTTPLPYDPYSADVWHDLQPKIYANGTWSDTANNPKKYDGGWT